MAIQDNPFYVAPADAFGILMAGRESYDKGKLDYGRKQAAQAMQSGADPKSVIGYLLSGGDVPMAKAVADYAATSAALGETSRYHTAQITNMEKTSDQQGRHLTNEEARIKLQQQQADEPKYVQGEEDPETGTRPWIMIPKGGRGVPQIVRPESSAAPPGMTLSGPEPIAPGSPALPNTQTVPYSAISPTPMAAQPNQIAQAQPGIPVQAPQAAPPVAQRYPPPPPGIMLNKSARQEYYKNQGKDAQDEPNQRSAALSTINNFGELIREASEIKTMLNEDTSFGMKRGERVTGRFTGQLPQSVLLANDPDLQSKITNIKDRMTGASLQNMRDSNKTGGAVGQVTEREWPRLQALAGNVVQAQSLPAFNKALDDLTKFLNGSQSRVERAYVDTHGRPLFDKVPAGSKRLTFDPATGELK